MVFTRRLETLDLGPDTQVQIHDRGTAAKPNTVVQQHFGTVSVEAQVENVQHVAVETPYLAAVVKGTRFTVTSGKTERSAWPCRGRRPSQQKPHAHCGRSVRHRRRHHDR